MFKHNFNFKHNFQLENKFFSSSYSNMFYSSSSSSDELSFDDEMSCMMEISRKNNIQDLRKIKSDLEIFQIKNNKSRNRCYDMCI